MSLRGMFILLRRLPSYPRITVPLDHMGHMLFTALQPVGISPRPAPLPPTPRHSVAAHPTPFAAPTMPTPTPLHTHHTTFCTLPCERFTFTDTHLTHHLYRICHHTHTPPCPHLPRGFLYRGARLPSAYAGGAGNAADGSIPRWRHTRMYCSLHLGCRLPFSHTTPDAAPPTCCTDALTAAWPDRAFCGLVNSANYAFGTVPSTRRYAPTLHCGYPTPLLPTWAAY